MSVAIVTQPYLVGIDLGDDAPVRAAGMMLFALIPVFFFNCCGYGVPCFRFIVHADIYILKNLFFLAGFVSIIVGLLFGLPSPFGLRDQLVGVLIFSTLAMLCLSLGVVAWWRLVSDRGCQITQPRIPELNSEKRISIE